MKRKFLFCILTAVLVLVIFSGSSFSDFGSFSGNSDYSSSRSTSRSSSSTSTSRSSTSRSSSSSGSYSFPTRTTRSDSSSTNLALPLAIGSLGRTNNILNSDSSSDEGFDECAGVAFIFFVFFVFYFLTKRKKKRRDPVIINTDEPVRILRPMSEYLELDPEFDEERIKTLMSNLYVQMQDAWRDKNISSLRPYMTDAFYNQMNRQLEQFRKMNQTDYTERIAVLNVGLAGWRQSTGRDYITVSLSSRIVSYVLDDLTGELISGDKDREKFMEYEIELSRKSGIITQLESEGTKSAVCPHCGAPLKLNASAQCEYCGSVITTVNTDWAICGMKGISQRTA